jgi:hypothetical protein
MATPLSTIRKDFETFTARIEDNPQHPDVWITRAKYFLNAYPDRTWPLLAVGDAYKAYKFCEPWFRNVHKLESVSLEQLKISKGNACNVLVPALLALEAIEDANKYVDEMTDGLSKEHRHLLFSSRKHKGVMKRQKFEFAPYRYFDRRNHLLAISRDFRKHGLTLKQSTMGPKGPTNLGVFAIRSFKEGEELFREETWKTDEADMGLLKYFLQGALDGFQNAAQNGENPVHILSRPDIGALSASYMNKPESFSLDENIIEILEILEERDTKLLWNMNFDLWTLHTLMWRLDTNGFAQTEKRQAPNENIHWRGISRLFSFFQHSCDPNVDWHLTRSADTMSMTTLRPIQAGQELFNTYIGTIMDYDLNERRALLGDWFGADCTCSLCSEEAEAKARAVNTQDEAKPDVETKAQSDNEVDMKIGTDAEGDSTMGDTE